MPRPDKFYLIELVEDPRGYREQDRHGHDNSSQPGAAVGDQGHDSTEQLRFSLAVRQAHRDTATAIGGRFGIKESTGGVGGDLYLLRRPADCCRSTSSTPRPTSTRASRRRSSYAIWKRNLFVVAGVDDMANYDRAHAGGGGVVRLVLRACSSSSTTRICKSLLLFGGGAAAGAASK